MSGLDNKNPERVAAGLKATIHNPTVSKEAKTRAQQRLQEMGVEVDAPASSQHAKETVDTLDEAEYEVDQEEESMLGTRKGLLCDTHPAPKGTYSGMDEPQDDDADFGNEGRSRGAKGGQEGEGREMGGYKATLKNPRVSKEAKAHAKEVLKDNDAI